MYKSPLEHPHFIIIGAMKSATSTLYAQLARQPSFFMSSPKEPNFFSDNEHWEKGLQWYVELFSSASNNQITGEASTHYTKLPTYPNTLSRMADNLPSDTKFIYIVRHPIDRLISHYIHGWTMNEISFDLDQALENHSELISYSLYHTQLSPYVETFGKHRILVLSHEQLSKNPQKILDKVGSFLGGQEALEWQDEAANMNASNERLRQTSVVKFVQQSHLLTALRRLILPEAIRDKIKSRWRMSDRPQLSPSQTQSLQEKINPDLEAFGAWFGLELNCNNFKEVSLEAEFKWSTE